MKKVLAVSGGVDSVVMLHKYKDDKDVIVAHFDHGIRDNSHEDCLFVEKLAKQYDLPFVFERAELGEKSRISSGSNMLPISGSLSINGPLTAKAIICRFSGSTMA